MSDSTNQNSFPIPLAVGWGVNIIGWVLFATTMNTAIELITAILCMGCVYKLAINTRIQIHLQRLEMKI